MVMETSFAFLAAWAGTVSEQSVARTARMPRVVLFEARVIFLMFLSCAIYSMIKRVLGNVQLVPAPGISGRLAHLHAGARYGAQRVIEADHEAPLRVDLVERLRFLRGEVDGQHVGARLESHALPPLDQALQGADGG